MAYYNSHNTARPLYSLYLHPEAYSRSFQCFLASTHQENAVLKCIEEHIVPLINKGVCELLESHSSSVAPFRVLSVGSGEGENDINLLEAFSKIRQEGKLISIINRVIEPDKEMLATFRKKAANLPEHFKGRANVTFEWVPMTIQEYSSQKETDDVKFDVVHFIHSVYYVEVEEVLVHCYEKELGRKGIIITVSEAEDTPVCRYAEEFQDRLVNSISRNKNVVAVAKQKGWKYFICPGDSKSLDITAIFDSSSLEGNYLFDFLTFRMDVRQNEKETVEKILKFWKEQSRINENGRRIVELRDNAVIIVKGFDPSGTFFN